MHANDGLVRAHWPDGVCIAPFTLAGSADTAVHFCQFSNAESFARLVEETRSKQRGIRNSSIEIQQYYEQGGAFAERKCQFMSDSAEVQV